MKTKWREDEIPERAKLKRVNKLKYLGLTVTENRNLGDEIPNIEKEYGRCWLDQ